MSVAAVLADIALGLEGERWALFGAQAVIAWSVPRVTADIDVTLLVEPPRRWALVQRLLRGAFDQRLTEDQTRNLVEQGFMAPLFHRQVGMGVDFVFAGSGFEHVVINEAVEIALGGVRVPVARPEHLVVMKVLAGRPKDLEDIRALLRVRAASLDVGVARSILMDLEFALDQSDLVPVLDQLVRETGRSHN